MKRNSTNKMSKEIQILKNEFYMEINFQLLIGEIEIIEEYRNSKRALLKWKFFKLGITRFAQNYMDSIQTLLNGRGHVISKSGKELIGFVIHNTNKVQNEIRSKVNEYIMECTGNSRMFSGEN